MKNDYKEWDKLGFDIPFHSQDEIKLVPTSNVVKTNTEIERNKIYGSGKPFRITLIADLKKDG